MINFNFTSYSSKQDLINLYSYLRSEEPLYWSDEHGAWIVSRYKDVVDGLGNYKLFTYEDTDSIVIRDLRCMIANKSEEIDEIDKRFFQIQLPPEYPQHRKKLLDIYNSAISFDLEDRIKLNIQNLFNRIDNRGEIDLVEELTNFIPLYTICDLMGYDHSIAQEIFYITSSFMNRSSIKDRIQLCKDSYNFLKNNPPPLVTNSNDKKIAISFCMGMFLGGTNSLTGTFPNMLYNIKNYNDQFKLIENNYNLKNNFIQETLRHTFIQSNLIRTASENFTMYGKEIKKGDLVAFLIGSANFDEEKFGSNAKDFSINRNYKKTNLAFGHGMYRCIGFQTALIQLNTFLSFIINNINNIKINSFEFRENRDFTGSNISKILGVYQS